MTLSRLMADYSTHMRDIVNIREYNAYVKARSLSESPTSMPSALGRLRVALEDAYTQAGHQVGITAQQAELLCAALRPASVGDIAVRLRCDRSNVTRLVDRALARGLVIRREGEDDARVRVVELTPEGETLAKTFFAVLESKTAVLRAEWPSGRQELAAGLLDDISEALDASSQPERRPKPRRRRNA